MSYGEKTKSCKYKYLKHKTIIGKEEEILEEIKKKHLRNKRSKKEGKEEMNHEYTLRYSGMEITERAIEGVGIITRKKPKRR